MSKKCVIEKYLYQSARAANFMEVKKEDFFMIADLALKQLAISKTETTSARALSCWYCTEMEKHGVVVVKTVLDKAGRELDAYETPCNFCSNCGRKLTCPE